MTDHSPTTHVQPPNLLGNPLLRFMQRRWRYLAIVLVASAGLAFLWSKDRETTVWTFTSSLLYRPNHVGAPHYQSPDVHTIVSLLKNGETLRALNKTFDPPLPLKTLANSIRTEIPMGSTVINVKMEGNHPQRTESLLNGLLTTFIERVQASRKQAMQEIVADLRRQLARHEQELAAAKLAQHDFVQREGIIDVDREIDRLRQELAALELQAEPDRAIVPAIVDDGSALKRQLLRELINDEKEAIQAKSQLELKRAELERVKSLHQRRYVSDAELQRVETELNALSAIESGVVQRHRERLTKLNEANLEQQPVAAVPGEGQAANRKRIAEMIAERSVKIARLTAVREQAADQASRVQSALNETQRVSATLANFEQLRDIATSDLTIVQAATPDFDPTRSNAKKLFVLALASLAAVMTLPLVAFDWVTLRQASSVIWSERFGIPLLARGLLPLKSKASVPRATTYRDSLRRLALRVQQSASAQGAVVLWSSFNPRKLPVETLLSVADCLAQRGERVVIVDTNEDPEMARVLRSQVVERQPLEVPCSQLSEVEPSQFESTRIASSDGGVAVAVERQVLGAVKPAQVEPHAPLALYGLSDYIALPWCAVDSVVHPTAVAGVEVLPQGTGPLPHESLAHRRMHDLIGKLRERCSVVLVAGPNAAHSVDQQVLASYCDAVVVCLPGGVRPGLVGEAALQELMELNAPLLGLVD